MCSSDQEDRKNKDKNHQELQNQDLLGFPHLEEEWIGGMVDLDLLSCFPRNGQESLEERVGIKLSRFATMEEREREQKVHKRSIQPLGKKEHLNRCPGKSGRWAQIPAGPVVPAQGAVLPPQVRTAPNGSQPN